MVWVNISPDDTTVDEVGVDSVFDQLRTNALDMRTSVFYLDLGSALTSSGSWAQLLQFWTFVPAGGGSPVRQLGVEVYADLQAGVTGADFRLYDVAAATGGAVQPVTADGYHVLELDLLSGWQNTFREVLVQARVTAGAGNVQGSVVQSFANRCTW